MSDSATSNSLEQSKKKAASAIFPILLVNFIGTLGFSLVLPFLVVLVLKFGGNEVIFGIMGATYSFFQLIGAPVLGNWSDRFGRKKILLLSQTGTFLAWILFAVALLIPAITLISVDSEILGVFTISSALVVLFVARALDGITGGNVSVANAYMADVSIDENRKSNFGKMGASANLGFIIGPALAGILGATAFGEFLPVLMAMLISLIAIFVIAFVLKESHPCSLSALAESGRKKNVFGQEQKDCYKLAGADRLSFRQVIKLNNIPFILIFYFLVFLAFSFFYVSFPVHAVQKLEWSLFKLGIFFSLLGFVLVCVEGPVLSKLSNRFSDSSLVIAGGLILTVSFFMLTSESDTLVFSSILFYSGGNGIMWPSFLSLLARVAGQKYQGAVQGYASSAGSLASICGLVIGGFVYGQLGVVTFAIPGILLFTIFLLSFKLPAIERSTGASG